MYDIRDLEEIIKETGLEKDDIVRTNKRSKENTCYYDLGVVSNIGEEEIYVKTFGYFDGSISSTSSGYSPFDVEKVSLEEVARTLKACAAKQIDDKLKELT